MKTAPIVMPVFVRCEPATLAKNVPEAGSPDGPDFHDGTPYVPHVDRSMPSSEEILQVLRTAYAERFETRPVRTFGDLVYALGRIPQG